jgi:hypothetical protein
VRLQIEKHARDAALRLLRSAGIASLNAQDQLVRRLTKSVNKVLDRLFIDMPDALGGDGWQL